MAAWIEERFGVRFKVSERDLADAKQLRDAVALLVTDASWWRPFRPEAVRIVDRQAAQPDVAPQLGRHPPPKVGQVLAAIAREAVMVLRDRAERISECSAGDCRVVYLDTSRSANRAWCSMNRCGNRHKVRRHRAR